MEQNIYIKSKYVIDSIRDKYSIVEYLSSIGIHPQREYDEKYIYLCPFKNHVETKPSFTVYRKPDGQEDFFCFGCKSSGNFIVLYAKMHEISWVDAIKELSKDFDFKISDHIDFVIKQLKDSLESDDIEENARDIFGFVSLNLSTIGYNYLVKTSFDLEEYSFLENFYKKIDQYIEQEDIHGLIKVNEFVNGKNKMKKNLFNLRLEKWIKQQREKMKEKIVGERING